MNKILVVTSFVFVSFLSCTGLTEKQRLADQILSDTALHKVDSMARATIRSGFNAGSGYSQINHAATLEGRFPQHIVARAVSFVLQSPVEGRARDFEGLDHLHPD